MKVRQQSSGMRDAKQSTRNGLHFYPTDMYIHIDLLEKDLLREVFNIGVSKAADALSMLLKNRKAIMLTVPDIKIIWPQELPSELKKFDETVLAVRSKLQGDINGISVLLFYSEHVDWIVQNSLSERELHREDFEQMRLSLLLEMSNILTGAVLTQFSNILGLEVQGMPPECIVTEPGRSMESIICELPPCQPIVLSVKTDFLDKQLVIELPLLIVLEIASLSTILNTIRQKGINENLLLKKRS